MLFIKVIIAEVFGNKGFRMSNLPSISIIIPSYNQGNFINRTIRSIIHQSYAGKVEVIVSDGGSEDNTVDILKSYGSKIKWWSKKDKGWADAVKKGLEVATGDIIGIQNSDDYYLENAFSAAVQTFNETPSVGMVTGSYYLIDESGNFLGKNTVPPWIYDCHSVFYYPGVYQHSTFFLRKCLDKINDLFLVKHHGAECELFYKILHFCLFQDLHRKRHRLLLL